VLNFWVSWCIPCKGSVVSPARRAYPCESGDKTYRAYGLTGVPETYDIDGRGRIVGHATTSAVSREDSSATSHPRSLAERDKRRCTRETLHPRVME